nr:MAG TPA: DNA repair protein [Bacteriophage sp.]
MSMEILSKDMERLHISSSFILNRVYRTALEYEKKNLVKGTHYCFMILADKNGGAMRYLNIGKKERGLRSFALMDDEAIISKIKKYRAKKVMFCFMHGSKDKTPTTEEYTFIGRLHHKLGEQGISLVDCLVETRDSFYSFADEKCHKCIEK